MHPATIIEKTIRKYGRGVTVACAFNALEGVAVVDMARKIDPDISVFMLDPGRLHPETYDLVRRCEEHYHMKVRLVPPDPFAVQKMEREYGEEPYRKSVALRQHCCDVLKVQQLPIALAGYSAWMVGVRGGQFDTRTHVNPIEENNPWKGITKISPCATWTREEASAYVIENDVPFNALLEQGYGSLACACCTRPLLPGEGDHEGKWWWEKDEKGERAGPLECGLHVIGKANEIVKGR